MLKILLLKLNYLEKIMNKMDQWSKELAQKKLLKD
jgi:hypothetical protein